MTMYVLASVSELYEFMPEVRALSVCARGSGRCRCARCRAYMQRQRVFVGRQKSFPGAWVPARNCPRPHVPLTK